MNHKNYDLAKELIKEYKMLFKNLNNKESKDAIIWLEQHKKEINKTRNILVDKDYTNIYFKEVTSNNLENYKKIIDNSMISNEYNELDQDIDNKLNIKLSLKSIIESDD